MWPWTDQHLPLSVSCWLHRLMLQPGGFRDLLPCLPSLLLFPLLLLISSPLLSSLLSLWNKVSCNPGWSQTRYVARDDHKLPFNPLSAELIDMCRHTCCLWFWVRTLGFLHARQALYQLYYISSIIPSKSKSLYKGKVESVTADSTTPGQFVRHPLSCHWQAYHIPPLTLPTLMLREMNKECCWLQLKLRAGDRCNP